MRTMTVTAGVLVAALIAATATAQPASKPGRPATVFAAAAPASPPTQARADDEKAIRINVEAFTKAYNAADARSLASLFAARGEIVNEEGENVQGQAAIERVFAAIFQAHPKSQIKVSVRSIRFVGPSLAIEDGRTTVTRQRGETAERNCYTVVHVKQDGTWRMASHRDLPDEEGSAAEEIEQLAWLIGDWVDESPDALVLTSYRWADDHQAILSEFKVQVGGRPAMTGTQRIGWDPLDQEASLLGVRHRGRLGRRRLDPQRQPVDRQDDRRDARRKAGVGNERHDSGGKGPDDLAIARSRGRRRGAAEYRRNHHCAKTAPTQIASNRPRPRFYRRIEMNTVLKWFL